MDRRGTPSTDDATGWTEAGDWLGEARAWPGAESAGAGGAAATGGCTQGCYSSQAGLATFRPWPVEQAVAAAQQTPTRR